MLTAFFVMLREGFEAALIVAILYAYLRKTSRHDLIPAMWGGVAAAAALSVAAGVAIHLSIESLEGEARLRAFAAISLFAVAVLTWMIFWMRKHARAIKGELQEVLDDAMERTGRVKWAIVAAAFFAVLREGLEAALFMIATATTEDGGEVLLGALLARTVMFLQTSGEMGIAWNNVYDLTSIKLLTVETETGRFLGAMFGWDPRPSIEQVIAYVGYVGTVTWLFLRNPKAAAPAAPGHVPEKVGHPTA